MSRMPLVPGLLVALLAGCSASPVTITPPRIAEGGRALSIAVASDNPLHIVVASETGGLFQTYDGGKSWLHLEGFPSYKPIDVAIASLAPQTIIATAQSQYRVINDGGIWRSTDGGASWKQPTGWAPKQGPTCPGRPSAYGISNMPLSHTFYVGTDCGLAISTDDGATWSSMILAPDGVNADSLHNRVHSVLVINTTSGVAVGDRGLWYLNGSAWTASASNPDAGGAVTHAFASPYLAGISSIFFHASAGQQLWMSSNGGAAWTQVSAPSVNNREAFVRIARNVSGDDSKFDVYYGDGQDLHRQTFSLSALTGGGWTDLHTDHSDPSDIAFDLEHRTPILLATDGGVHLSTDQGSDWTLTGGGYGGFDALQLSEVDGQAVTGSAPHLDLYFATQDNYIWESPDGGQTWPVKICCEGRYMRPGARGTTDQESRITVSACGPCSNIEAGPHFESPTGWPNAPNGSSSDPADAPFQLVGDAYVQDVVNQQASPPSFDFYLTLSAGSVWAKAFSFALAPIGAISFAGSPANPTMYEGIQRLGQLSNGGTQYGINRVTNIAGQAVVIRADSFGMGGVGSLRTPSGRYIAFGVDPNNPLHLIAPDVESGDMKYSTDGGITWYALPQLTQAVTDSGRYLFTLSELSLASVVAWDPYDACHILVGTNENGVIRSTDGGNTWARIAGSTAATNVSSFFFPPSGSVWMSTDGRGLWRLELNRPAGGSGTKCSFPRPPRLGPPIDSVVGINPSNGSVAVFSGLRDSAVCPRCTLVTVRNGWVTGLTLSGDTLRQLSISGGTIARLTASGKEIPLGVANTYGPGTGTLERRVPGAILAGSRRIRGLVLDGAHLRLLIASSGDLPFAPQRAPIVVAYSATKAGARTVAQGDSLRVVGAHFLPASRGGGPLRILFGGTPVATTAAVRADGSFSIDLPVQQKPGELVVTVEQRDDGRLTMERTIIEVESADTADRGARER